MAFKSKIEWTESTWNPVSGCSKISAGCANCYAERMAKRLQAMGNPSYANGFDVTLHEKMLNLPFTWREPRRVFVNSMSDLFHEDVPFDFIRSVFKTMAVNKQHTFQILTKRANRLSELASSLPWAENIWMGVTVESAEYTARLDALRTVPASIRFVSFEPLLSAIPLVDLAGISWAIVGGESGPHCRKMEEAWAIDLRNQCITNSVAFFFKQWGGTRRSKLGRELDGSTWSQMPASSTTVCAQASA